MNILSTKQVRQCDAFTISKGISGLDLMEKAAKACLDVLIDYLTKDSKIVALAGPGNNGGDAWVIARYLNEYGFNVAVCYLNTDRQTDENRVNQERYISGGGKCDIWDSDFSFDGVDVIIDGLLGSGLSRPLEGQYLELAEAVNYAESFVISIDAPSGFYSDEPMPEKAVAVRAQLTLCLHSPRLMYFFPESEPYLGSWQIISFDLDEPKDASFQQEAAKYQYVLGNDLSPFLKRRAQFSHKGNYGHALLIGGSKGKIGAITLAASACLRTGAGKTTVLLPAAYASVMHSSLPEVMVLASEADEHIEGSFNTEVANSIGIGPGFGLHDESARLLKRIMQDAACPLVIDADALNCLAENPTWLAFLPANTILTPHPGELDRLCGKAGSGYERFENARELSRKFNCTVILKGAFTAICFPDGRVSFNSTGNPGLAKGGSGDVLTGIISGLLAQSYSTEMSCVIGVFAHGLAADLAAEETGEQALIASDVIRFLSDAWQRMTLA